MKVRLRSVALLIVSGSELAAVGCVNARNALDGGADGTTNGGSDAAADSAPDTRADAADEQASDAGHDADATVDWGEAGCATPLSGVVLTDVLQIATGAYHACAVRTDRSMVCWGDNQLGQLGVDATMQRSSKPSAVHFPVDAGAVQIRSIVLGRDTTFAIDSLQHLWAWGDNSSGQLGNGTAYTGPNAQPQLVAMSGHPIVVRSVASNSGSACALQTSGEVDCWGSNAYGELGPAVSADASYVPVAALSAMPALTANSLIAGGQAGFFQVGGDFCYATGGTATGDFQCWGTSGDGLLLYDSGPALGPEGGVISVSGVNHSAQVPLLEAGAVFPIRELGYGSYFSCALDSAHVAFCWGGLGDALGSAGVSGYTHQPLPVAVLRSNHLSTGWGHVCFVSTGGEVLCRGDNYEGQLGRVTSTAAEQATLSPVLTADAAALSNVAAVSAGGIFSCAIIQDCGDAGTGSVVCWGDNHLGELGSYGLDAATSVVPIPVPAP